MLNTVFDTASIASLRSCSSLQNLRPLDDHLWSDLRALHKLKAGCARAVDDGDGCSTRLDCAVITNQGENYEARVTQL